MPNQYARALCVACACVLVVSGCGGGGGKRNQAPTANNLAIATAEDTAQTGTITASDPDGDALTAAVATAPTRGDVVVTSGMSFTYTPRANQNGADQFTMRISDGRGASATATVSVTITAVNDAPQIQPTLALDEDQPSTTQIATEVDGETFQLTLVTPPAHGTVSFDPTTTGRITYTPNGNYFGADTMQFTATDALSTTTTAVAITVRAVNDAPVTTADTATTTQQSTVVADVLANDSDVDDATLTLSIVTPPPHGTAAVAAGRIEYSSGTFLGETLLIYQVRDAAGATANGTLTLRSAVRTPIVYPTAAGGALYFSDGIWSFRLHDPLPVGARVLLVKAAKTAPLVFFTVFNSVTTDLFYADLRQPGTATRLTRQFTSQGDGVGEFAISDDGSKVAYWQNGGQNMWLIETAHPGVETRLGTGGGGVTMDAAGTRVLYTVRPFTPTQQPSAIFTVELANPGVETPVTPFAQPPDTVSSPLYLKRDGHTLYYAIGQRVFGVDPAVPGSDFSVFDLTTTTTSLLGPLDDETTFSGTSSTSAIHGYVLRAGNPGTVVRFSDGTSSSGAIRAHAPTLGGTKVFYLRSNSAGRNSDLYRVDMSNPAVSVPITAHYTVDWGIWGLALSPDESQIFYATLDTVPNPGGGAVPGNSDVYVLRTDGSAPARHLQHFDQDTYIGEFAPDGRYVIVRDGPGRAQPALNAFNALDPGQNLRLDLLSGTAGYGETVFVVAP
jgi:VCBS repeat-containing protein